METKYNTIREAVEPLKQDARKWATKMAKDIVARVEEELAAANNDLHVAAPYPTCADRSYHAKRANYLLFASLTVWRKGSVSPNEPCYADIDTERAAKFVKEYVDGVEAKYLAFVAKMEKKIGAHSSATLTGNHIWSWSFLTVETPTGTQIWKTQQIMNQSKYGYAFPQWPSRKVKEVK